MTNWLHAFVVFPARVLFGVNRFVLTKGCTELGANVDEAR